MSMTKEAVEHIQESANIPALIAHLESVETEIPLALVPKGMELQSLESRMPHASRYRMGYSTTSLLDFVEYNKEFDANGATCFVDAESMSAISLLDLGTIEEPGHKQHRAKLRLKRAAAFSALLDINGFKLSQKKIAEFIEDWADLLVIHNQAGDTMSTQQATKCFRDLTIETAREVNSQVNDYSESMSAMERVEAKNQSSMPTTMTFTCNPYQALEPRAFQVRLSLITGDDRPTISFRIVRLEAIEEAIAEEFKGILLDAFEDHELETYIGQP